MQNALKNPNSKLKKDNAEYWDEFYKNVLIQEESTFCKYIKTFFEDSPFILDLGCGSGRDSYAFAREGFKVVGVDRSREAIKFNQELNGKLNKSVVNIEFFRVDLNDEKALRELIITQKNKAEVEGKRIVIYLRFVLHSINKLTEQLLLSILSDELPKGSYLAAEFRTTEDEMRNKVYGDHFRRFISAEDLLGDLRDKYKFKQILFTKGTGLSIYKGEDPYLGRIIVEKN
ncbi:class I SAM-dependent methyltransferase [Pontibacillus salipaludis]|uniref:class I SAM-dependent methyltransferase n=1 Tax=Pontibacillus salipaludis TaxID=1697394 RepID=UPI0031E94AF8